MTITSTPQANSTYQPTYLMDLSCKGYKGEVITFKVELQTYAIDNLIEATSNALCIYEIFAIRRVGDIWKYLWLKPIELPSRIQSRYESARKELSNPYGRAHPWSSDQIPFLTFDDWFYWNYDIDPEDEAWMYGRNGDALKLFAESCYSHVKQAQMSLRLSEDLLVKSTLRLIDSGQHKYDYSANIPFNRSRQDEKTYNFHRHSKPYYEKLAEVLALPEINSVAYRDGNDFQTMRLCCNEQLRRVYLLGISVDEFVINAIGNLKVDAESWGCKVWFYEEGLGHGDLFIQQEDDYGTSIKELFEIGRWGYSKYILSIKDEGELPRYQREINTDWVVYRLIQEDMGDGVFHSNNNVYKNGFLK
jgi:hypothetical protein